MAYLTSKLQALLLLPAVGEKPFAINKLGEVGFYILNELDAPKKVWDYASQVVNELDRHVKELQATLTALHSAEHHQRAEEVQKEIDNCTRLIYDVLEIRHTYGEKL